MRKLIAIIGLLLLPTVAVAQINTFQAQQGYVTSIQNQLNNLQQQINAALLPPTASAGQFVVENAAGTAYIAVSLSGDVTGSVTTPGQITVNGSSASTFAVTNAETVGTTLGVTGASTLNGLVTAGVGVVNDCVWSCTMSAGVCATAVPCLANFSRVAITGVSGGVNPTTLATPANTPAVIACAQPSAMATSIHCLASTANATPVVNGIGY